MGGGAGDRHDLARRYPPHRSEEIGVLHRARPVASLDRLVGRPIRHAELRGPWRLLLGQHGRRRALYSIGGSFWEFGEPDWERTRYFLMFGVAEDHDSNPIKIGLGQLKGRLAGIPREIRLGQSGPHRLFSAIADEWLGITPGTDGLFVLALVHELFKADRIDLDFLVRYTNAPWLVIDAPGTADHGLFARDAEGNPLCCDQADGRLASALLPEVAPRLVGEVTLPDGRRRGRSLR